MISGRQQSRIYFLVISASVLASLAIIITIVSKQASQGNALAASAVVSGQAQLITNASDDAANAVRFGSSMPDGTNFVHPGDR